ncbi:hypothetical protein Pelo_6567 [Pelomyxa schiedti]|nr:hypothetical protein Pelo_6567 [Pelomyxa schiedti]
MGRLMGGQNSGTAPTTTTTQPPPTTTPTTPVAVASSSPPKEVAVKWSGWYEQNGAKSNWSFMCVENTADGSMSGSGCDSIGTFTIQGTNWGGQVDFAKSYRTHVVSYTGKRTAKTMSGRWSLPGCSGTFQMQAN